MHTWAPAGCPCSTPRQSSGCDAGADGNAYRCTPRAGFVGHNHFQVTATAGSDTQVMRKTTRVVVMHNQQPTYRTWVVDATNGKDNNPGHEAAPVATLKAAHEPTGPGDTVLVKNGRYEQTGIEGVVHITRSGLPGAFITYKPWPGHKPVLSAATAWNVVLVTASYIRIEGFEVVGAADRIPIAQSEAVYERFVKGPEHQTWGFETSYVNGNGVRPQNQNAPLADRIVPRHVHIVGNQVHNLAGGGIYTDMADHIVIEGNRVHDTAWRSIFANSGLSLFHSFDIDNDTRSYKNIIRNNVVWRNRGEVKWYVPKKISDGNGIIVDDLRNTQIKGVPYRGRTLVVGNVSHDNGGAGIQVFSSDNVDVVHNTVANNSLMPPLNYGEHYVHNDHNVYFGPVSPIVVGPNDRIADPRFVDYAGRNLRLRADSPAIESAGGPAIGVDLGLDLEGRPRNSGSKADRGAHEYRRD